MKKEHNADCAIMHGGNIRSDRLFQKGFMNYGDWNEINPFNVGIVLLEATGAQIIECLENGVSKVPALEGRFPQVSGIKFSFDATREPGHRVDQLNVTVNDQPIDLGKIYRVAVTDYMSWAKDGYNCLLQTKKIVDTIVAPDVRDVVVDFLGKLK